MMRLLGNISNDMRMMRQEQSDGCDYWAYVLTHHCSSCYQIVRILQIAAINEILPDI